MMTLILLIGLYTQNATGKQGLFRDASFKSGAPPATQSDWKKRRHGEKRKA
jgi:hypothetical protein